MKNKLYTIVFLYVFLGVTAAIYWLGASGPFLLDDFHNLQSLGNYGGVTSWEDAKRFIFGNGSGPMGRSVSMATFLLNDFTWPVYSVASFKLTNLALHLCVGLVLLLVLRRLLAQEFKLERSVVELLSLLVFAFWLTHPIHVSTVLYVVQRMAILSSFFSLLAFLFYLQFRFSLKNRIVPSSVLNTCLFIVFFLLAIFSKENALLLIPFIYICEVFIFNSLLPNKIRKKAVLLTYVLLLTSPMWLYLTFDLWGKGYAAREFNLIERVILQVAVLGDYIGKIIFPTVERMNFFNERFSPSAISIYNSSFLIGILFSFFFLILFVISALKKNRLVIFGLTWFVCFHLLESTIIPLEIYYEHRNYLPSIGLIIGSVGIIYSPLNRNFSKGLAYFFFVSILMYLCFTTLILTKTWGDADSLYIKLSADEPSSIRAKVSYASYLEARGLPEFALAEIEEALKLRPDIFSLRLNKVRLICKFDLKGNISEEFKGIEQADLFDSGVTFQLKQLVKLERKYCPQLEQDDSLIEYVFAEVSELKGFDIRPKMGGEFFYLVADYYVDKRKFTPAMEALDKAISYTPTVDLFVRKIVLLTSAGLYRDALSIVPEALNADERRGNFIPSRSAEIEFLQKSLHRQIKNK
ncbi:MAG: tetratricopeptide (TPR) repeat protein [Patiriisocius sp.]|jgi:tetratricopeptide (TPR) repeat protein